MDYLPMFLAPFQSAVEAFRLAAKSLDRIATVMEKEQTQNGSAPTEQSILAAALGSGIVRPDRNPYLEKLATSPKAPLGPTGRKNRKAPPK